MILIYYLMSKGSEWANLKRCTAATDNSTYNVLDTDTDSQNSTLLIKRYHNRNIDIKVVDIRVVPRDWECCFCNSTWVCKCICVCIHTYRQPSHAPLTHIAQSGLPARTLASHRQPQIGLQNIRLFWRHVDPVASYVSPTTYALSRMSSVERIHNNTQ